MPTISRRTFLPLMAAPVAARAAAPRPNVVLIMTDDQGYGDFSFTGNPYLKTPGIDKIASEGVQFTQFQVCPVCSPTRASLMTGRYNYRMGVVDTFLGRAMMDPKETTVAELFARAGYRTGIFGKWHLGDNYPMRAMDKGFNESLVLGGGGLTQPADPPQGNTYFDPVLMRNGVAEKTSGYCTDVFFREAEAFLERNRSKPFFLYIPTNAPHTPLQVDEKYVTPFEGKGLDDTTAKIYGMCVNLDENVSRLTAALERLNLANQTILIFLSDNGPQQKRFNAGMRGLKGSVYQGGIRVPCLMRWPGHTTAGSTIDRPAAHIDLMPTLLAACGISGKRIKVDGRNLLPLLRNQAWPERTLFTQWHRGDEPVLFKNQAARMQRWKLVNGAELYDLENDPGESKDVASAHPDVVANLRAQTESWFRDVSSRGYAPPRIYVGTSHENPVLLSRQDWRGPQAGWAEDSIGYWELDVRRAGIYQVKLLFAAAAEAGEAELAFGPIKQQVKFEKGAESCVFSSVRMPFGPARLAPTLHEGAKERGVLYAEVQFGMKPVKT